ncbi:hypothetical protein OR1_03052 [Geobacter sp. OR-1]|uniref:hypothetical protein n=1 Tax=Geobacter sp. OR-1 TaxID=1266765 RepID=UPI000543DFCB|nr:hypothetical protein [Geobacter sp. OR-1]GAM10755.1 hypothetical protein OR1_03052 [Geobacter sp. OR-1]
MQSITSKFSLKDFIAYLFPGLTWLLSLFVTLSVNKGFRDIFLNTEYINKFIAAAIFYCIPLAYLLGAIASSVGHVLEDLLIKICEIPIKSTNKEKKKTDDEKEKIDAFFYVVNDVLNVKIDKDSINKSTDLIRSNYFYLARTFVGELLPYSLEHSERQDTVRQMRRNSLVPVISWVLTGVTWYFLGDQLSPQQKSILLTTSLFFGFIVLWALCYGIYKNRASQLRDIYLGLLALPSLLNIQKENKPSNNRRSIRCLCVSKRAIYSNTKLHPRSP